MIIKRLDYTELEQTLAILEKFNKYYNFGNRFNSAKTRQLLELALFKPEVGLVLLAKEEEKVVGVLAAICTPQLFSDDLQASEVCWFVEEDYRSSGSSLEFIKQFETWAKEEAKADYLVLGYTTKMVNLKNFYTRLGYEEIEHSHFKKL